MSGVKISCMIVKEQRIIKRMRVVHGETPKPLDACVSIAPIVSDGQLCVAFTSDILDTPQFI